ncbi:hypothetical protein K493DRAFT_405125 [Basidiobolus meristosporus CBS 931.73]|uniref:Pseudouridine synthase RsuA/RluA-like domain-containing protein n=1 Tax=Basidiobolus meristosporus CBS 931.73 TaxID=1314790 RepID=A0A1Y1YYT0_9FUNG|nr:hypothetical protein K493DRAFT_405125 [Basidiobolus meristosporus CBS 931.73]|eukprot:ORY03024.1 hypothetical protein K493DRAFT_405125 [Basidiobolus meristosporus CBS 931.73]
MKLSPQTGRKHQLRIHCAQFLQTPILGDVKYGPIGQGHTLTTLGYHVGTLFLHMHKLTIPVSNEDQPSPLIVEAPLPKHFLHILNHHFGDLNKSPHIKQFLSPD